MGPWGRWETGLWFSMVSTVPPFPRLSGLWLEPGLAQLAGGRVAANHVRAIPDRHRPIQMFMDSDRAASQRTAEAALLQLRATVPDRDCVVVGHHALGLHREDPAQVPTRRTAKCASFLGRLHRELLVERCHILLA